jgi:hypothetical protein
LADQQDEFFLHHTDILTMRFTLLARLSLSPLFLLLAPAPADGYAGIYDRRAFRDVEVREVKVEPISPAPKNTPQRRSIAAPCTPSTAVVVVTAFATATGDAAATSGATAITLDAAATTLRYVI